MALSLGHQWTHGAALASHKLLYSWIALRKQEFVGLTAVSAPGKLPAGFGVYYLPSYFGHVKILIFCTSVNGKKLWKLR